MLDPVSVWVHEKTAPDQNIRFDAILGHRFSSVPSRIACIASNGTIESVGTMRGNNHGFPDRDDFEARRSEPRRKRIAVLGDSFTAAQFMPVNWPDRVEELTRDNGRPLELLNFAVAGGGLANWWSVLTRFIEPRDYELDGVIFAVFGNDLSRTFTWWDDGAYALFDPPRKPRVSVGQAYSFNPASLPATLMQARGQLREDWHVLEPEQFDRALEGEWVPRPERAFELFFVQRARRLVDRFAGSEPSLLARIRGRQRLMPGQLRLVADMRRYLTEYGLPVMIIHIPSMLDRAGTPPSSGTLAFARILSARFVNGTLAFGGLSDIDFEKHWMPYDGHWNQQGSDRFAQFIVSPLEAWLAHEAPVENQFH